jgi:hypothetical protein
MPQVDRERLANEAYRVADVRRDGRLTREAALSELAQRCPGVTRTEYERAFKQGLFESR